MSPSALFRPRAARRSRLLLSLPLSPFRLPSALRSAPSLLRLLLSPRRSRPLLSHPVEFHLFLFLLLKYLSFSRWPRPPIHLLSLLNAAPAKRLVRAVTAPLSPPFRCPLTAPREPRLVSTVTAVLSFLLLHSSFLPLWLPSRAAAPLPLPLLAAAASASKPLLLLSVLPLLCSRQYN